MAKFMKLSHVPALIFSPLLIFAGLLVFSYEKTILNDQERIEYHSTTSRLFMKMFKLLNFIVTFPLRSPFNLQPTTFFAWHACNRTVDLDP